jgi:hypothetical protein
MTDVTFAVANPSDSVLMGLAREVLKTGSSGVAAWPTLDLADPRQRQFGDYELLEELGRGGMGVVYRARQKSLERDVAIKFIAEWFADRTNVTRFITEARAAARLVHPNIVPVHEVGTVEGVHYFSMPLIEGRSLESLLDDGTLQTDVMIRLLLKLCEAIDYAHRLGLLHLDLKPANVLIDKRDEPLITDFGLARHMDEHGGVDAQEVSGTPSFMAPEQILIKQYRLTPATDIYALGAILYTCITGESPHGVGKADDVIRRAAAGRIRALRELSPKIPRDIDAICMKCLELQPSDRYSSAAQLADDLRRVRDGLPVSVRRATFLERMQRWFRREPKVALAATLAALALIFGTVATTWQWKQTAAERDNAQIAGEIGAHLFAYKGDDSKRAEDLLKWLRTRLPGAEDRQARALTAFATSIDAEDRGTTESLLLKVVQVLGTDYRQQMIRTLQVGSNPDRHLYSALLAFADEGESDAPEKFAAYLKAAIEAKPDDPFVWHTAAVFCPRETCLYPNAAENLRRLDPDNMYVWLLSLIRSNDENKQREYLHQAAQRARFDDYSLATFASYPKAIDAANVPAPALIARPAQLLAPQDRPESVIAYLSIGSFPIAPYQSLAKLCGSTATGAKVTDPQIRSDCLTVGELMVRANSHAAIVSQMIGVAIVRNLSPDAPLAEEAKQKRRLYQYAVAMTDKLSRSQIMSYSAVRFLRDLTSVGELDAWRRRIQFFGVPDQPPADWQPDDPTVLLSGRERINNFIALVREGKRLVDDGRFAEAVDLLAPQEGLIRQFFNKDNSELWRVPGYLAALGKARAALHQYPTAKANLTEACETFAAYGLPYKAVTRDCMQALISLYTAWDAAEPNKGHNAHAAEWKQKLARVEAMTDD